LQLDQETARKVLISALSQNQAEGQSLSQGNQVSLEGKEPKNIDGTIVYSPDPIDINLNISPQTVNLLPGVFHLQKGFNAYKGVPFFEGAQSDKDIFTFTFNDGKGTSGDTGYLVPDQMDIPPLSYMCIYSDRASEVV